MTTATPVRGSGGNGSVLPLGRTLAFSATSLPIAAVVLAIVVSRRWA
jgi:hypothetical protein